MQKISLRDVFGEGESKFIKYRELWEQCSSGNIVTDFPLHLDVELSGICNLRCEHCFQNGLITTKLGLMDFDLFKSILAEAIPMGVCGMKLQVRGESLLHPRFFEMARLAKDSGIIDLQLTTNGTLLRNKEIIDELIHCGLDGIIFSYDDHHGVAIQKKIPEELNIKNNILAFLERKSAYQGKTPWVRIQRALSDKNFCMEEATQSMREQFPGADRILINRLHNFSVDCDSYEQMQKRFVVNLCSYPFQRLTIYWDGDITVCCNDYNNMFKLGKAGEPSAISKAWMSPSIQTIRNGLLNKERHSMPICKHCHAGLSMRQND